MAIWTAQKNETRGNKFYVDKEDWSLVKNWKWSKTRLTIKYLFLICAWTKSVKNSQKRVSMHLRTSWSERCFEFYTLSMNAIHLVTCIILLKTTNTVWDFYVHWYYTVTLNNENCISTFLASNVFQTIDIC